MLGGIQSWVVVDLDGKAVLETFNPKLVAALNTNKYRAVPILEYLSELNAKIRAANTQKDRS